ncbi:hypothetical protein J6590_063615 [Homalodisca vitripennis]|nr:hypothetical protein J6590_063615 [Homalodisca vitripennis]
MQWKENGRLLLKMKPFFCVYNSKLHPRNTIHDLQQDLEKYGVKIHDSMVWKRLLERGRRAVRLQRKQFLTATMMKKLLNWQEIRLMEHRRLEQIEGRLVSERLGAPVTDLWGAVACRHPVMGRLLALVLYNNLITLVLVTTLTLAVEGRLVSERLGAPVTDLWGAVACRHPVMGRLLALVLYNNSITLVLVTTLTLAVEGRLVSERLGAPVTDLWEPLLALVLYNNSITLVLVTTLTLAVEGRLVSERLGAPVTDLWGAVACRHPVMGRLLALVLNNNSITLVLVTTLTLAVEGRLVSERLGAPVTDLWGTVAYGHPVMGRLLALVLYNNSITLVLVTTLTLAVEGRLVSERLGAPVTDLWGAVACRHPVMGRLLALVLYNNLITLVLVTTLTLAVEGRLVSERLGAPVTDLWGAVACRHPVMGRLLALVLYNNSITLVLVTTLTLAVEGRLVSERLGAPVTDLWGTVAYGHPVMGRLLALVLYNNSITLVLVTTLTLAVEGRLVSERLGAPVTDLWGAVACRHPVMGRLLALVLYNNSITLVLVTTLTLAVEGRLVSERLGAPVTDLWGAVACRHPVMGRLLALVLYNNSITLVLVTTLTLAVEGRLVSERLGAPVTDLWGAVACRHPVMGRLLALVLYNNSITLVLVTTLTLAVEGRLVSERLGAPVTDLWGAVACRHPVMGRLLALVLYNNSITLVLVTTLTLAVEGRLVSERLGAPVTDLWGTVAYGHPVMGRLLALVLYSITFPL